MKILWVCLLACFVLVGCSHTDQLVSSDPDGIGGTGITSYRLLAGPDGIGGTGIIGPVTQWQKSADSSQVEIGVNGYTVALYLDNTTHNLASVTSAEPGIGETIALLVPRSPTDPVQLWIMNQSGVDALGRIAGDGLFPDRLNIKGTVQVNAGQTSIAGVIIDIPTRLQQQVRHHEVQGSEIHLNAEMTRRGLLRVRRILSNHNNLPSKGVERAPRDVDQPANPITPGRLTRPSAEPTVKQSPVINRPVVIQPPVRSIDTPKPQLAPTPRPVPDSDTPSRPVLIVPPVRIDRPKPDRINPVAIEQPSRPASRD